MSRYMMLGLLVGIALGPCPAEGQTCLLSATNAQFGAYDALAGSSTDSTSKIDVSCSSLFAVDVAYTIKLGPGSGGSYAGRTMTSAASNLSYQLYTGPSRTQIWGDGSGGTASVSDGYRLSGSLLVSRSYTVYGRIPGRQAVVPGVYIDNVLVTLAY